MTLYHRANFNDTMYVVPLVIYSASKNGVTLKMGVGVVGH